MADSDNIRCLPAYIGYLYNYAPSQCHGSIEKVRDWKGLHPSPDTEEEL